MVHHQRTTPTTHAFSYRVHYQWFDPDRPEDLCGPSPLWSSDRPAPVRFRRRDYGARPAGGDDAPAPVPAPELGGEVRADLAPVLGAAPTGPIRMLTQLRRWGWLFNPLTVYVAWDDPTQPPVGAVLEVTSTPWYERERYAVALTGPPAGPFDASFGKSLHVSPFLGEDYRYAMRLHGDDGRIRLDLDVVDDADTIVLETVLDVQRRAATPGALARSALTAIAPTHRVTAAIHAEAARLWAKRVTVVPHPAKRKTSP